VTSAEILMILIMMRHLIIKIGKMLERNLMKDYQPDLYYYWDSPIEEDYDWRCALPSADCLCEICFDILNAEKKIKWRN